MTKKAIQICFQRAYLSLSVCSVLKCNLYMVHSHCLWPCLLRWSFFLIPNNLFIHLSVIQLFWIFFVFVLCLLNLLILIETSTRHCDEREKMIIIFAAVSSCECNLRKKADTIVENSRFELKCVDSNSYYPCSFQPLSDSEPWNHIQTFPQQITTDHLLC